MSLSLVQNRVACALLVNLLEIYFIVIEIEDGSEPELPDLHLIVTSALEPSIVYQ